MSVQIVSDLHLEAPKAYDVYDVVPKAPVLALLGDIGNAEPDEAALAAFLERQLHQFEAVLYVPGNHEAYHSTWPATMAILRSIEADVRARRAAAGTPSFDPLDAGLGALVVLDRGVYRLPRGDTGSGPVVLGCSLFSAVAPAHAAAVGQGLNDFLQSGAGWDVAAHNRHHARDLAWLNATVRTLEHDDTCTGILVLTHWSPTTDARAADPRHAGSPLGSAFATDLSREPCFRSPHVQAWAFGHTHYNCDLAVARDDDAGAGPLRLVTNQRGYDFAQAAGFDGEKTLSLEDEAWETGCSVSSPEKGSGALTK